MPLFIQNHINEGWMIKKNFSNPPIFMTIQ